MSILNPAIAGSGNPTGQNSSANAITVTGANDFVFVSNSFEPFIGMTLTAAGVGANPSADQFLSSQKGVKIAVDITAITGTSPTLTVKIQGKDGTSGKYYDMLTSTALNAVGTTVLTLYPGVTPAANVAVSDHLPAVWRVLATVGGTGPAVTATLGACLLS